MWLAGTQGKEIAPANCGWKKNVAKPMVIKFRLSSGFEAQKQMGLAPCQWHTFLLPLLSELYITLLWHGSNTNNSLLFGSSQSTCRYVTFITCEMGTRFYRCEVWRIREYVIELLRAETSVGPASLILGLLCIPHATLIFSIYRTSSPPSKYSNLARSMPGDLAQL